MGIWDVFTGAPAQRAAANTRGFLDATRTAGNTNIDNALSDSYRFIGSGNTAGRRDLTGGYNAAGEAIGTGANTALSDLDTANGNARGYYDAATEAFAPLSALGGKYGGATTMALNALGVNGQAGTDAARTAFKAGPAFNFNLDTGIDAINRRRAMSGDLKSGNADRDAQTFGAGLASNEFNNWENNLLSFTNPELSATSGAAAGTAGVNTARAGSETALGVNRAGIETGRAGMLADLSKRYGIDMAGIDTGEGNTLAGLTTAAAGSKNNLATSLAGPYANTYTTEANAQMAGGANALNLALSLARLGVGAGGGFTGTGGSTSVPGAGTSGGWFGGGRIYTGDPTFPGFG